MSKPSSTEPLSRSPDHPSQIILGHPGWPALKLWAVDGVGVHFEMPEGITNFALPPQMLRWMADAYDRSQDA